MKNTIVNLLKTLFFFDMAVVAVFFLPYKQRSTPALTTLSKETVFLAVTVVLTFVFWLLAERRKLKIFCFKKVFRHYSIGLICGVLPIAVTVVFLWVTKHLHFSFNNVKGVAIWLLALVFNTVATELLFRGYLFRLYRKCYGFPIAVLLISALAFSMNYSVFSMGKICVLNFLLFNIILCFTAEYTQSFSAPLTAHFVYRLISAFALGSLTVSKAYPSLFEMAVSGSPRLTGGEKGLEGSVILLIAQVGVTLWFIRRWTKGKTYTLPAALQKPVRLLRQQKGRKKRG